jgi:hypothetical protein
MYDLEGKLTVILITFSGFVHGNTIKVSAFLSLTSNYFTLLNKTSRCYGIIKPPQNIITLKHEIDYYH